MAIPLPHIVPMAEAICFSPNSRVQSSQISSTTRRCAFIITSSYKSRNGNTVDSENKREFLEKYGLNPDDYLTKPSPKIKWREQGKTGNVKEMPVEEPRPSRETHKLLQVLGGTARRKKLLSPKGVDVRPMMEVVKAAAFSILQAAGGSPQYLRPGRWLDLYSGTGSVGIEAMSRGCAEVHFVEMDPWVISDVLRPNLESTGFLDVSVIHSVRVETFFQNAERFVGKDGVFDYISVTPPYMLVDYAVLMDQISKSSIVGENTFMVVEYPLRTDMLDSCGHLVKNCDQAMLLQIFSMVNLPMIAPPCNQWIDDPPWCLPTWPHGLQVILCFLGFMTNLKMLVGFISLQDEISKGKPGWFFV